MAISRSPQHIASAQVPQARAWWGDRGVKTKVLAAVAVAALVAVVVGVMGVGVALGHAFGLFPPLGREEACPDKVGGCADRAQRLVSGTGAQRTCSMRDAPVASITSRSNPSAMPLASGIWLKAARKSSSTG